MAEKIISGDSLQNEFVAKFNGMADEVNELKESSVGSGGAVVELSGESGTLTDEQYAQCILPNTTIKWLNGSGGNMIYEPWRFVSPTYYFKSVYIDADECINNTIEIDQISHGWKRKSTAYGGGGPQVSVTQTLTSGTKIGAITVDGKTTALYAPEGGGSGGSSGSADAIIDVEQVLPPVGNEKAIYRVTPIANLGFMMSGMYVANGDSIQGATINIIPVAIIINVIIDNLLSHKFKKCPHYISNDE